MIGIYIKPANASRFARSTRGVAEISMCVHSDPHIMHEKRVAHSFRRCLHSQAHVPTRKVHHRPLILTGWYRTKPFSTL